MCRNKITFIILLIPAFLFMQGCLENTLPPETVNQLQAPRLLYPPNDTTDVDIPMTFSWAENGNIQDYILQISTDSLFKTLSYIHNGRMTYAKDVTGLSNRTKYYWRVSAINGYGEFRWSIVWKFTTGKSCPGIPKVEYSGKIYKTVQIGPQCWLRENLDVGTMILGSDTAKDNYIIEKYCYNNAPANCNTYGGLYQWDEAMQYTNVEGSQGICPIGWHIPTYMEFHTCSTAVGGNGNALKSIGVGTDSGVGTNTSGFSALLSGGRSLVGYFGSLGFISIFWRSTEYSSTHAYSFSLYFSNSYVYFARDYKNYGFSIRCLKD